MLLNTSLEKQSILEALKKMNNLMFIKLKGLIKKLDCLIWHDDTSLSFKHLKYLEWKFFPFRHINFDMDNLVVIRLKQSKLEILWEGFKNLKKLRTLDVRGSKLLSRTGNFIGLENLEELVLDGCDSLKKVDSSIVCLGKLREMSFSGCSSIKSIPNLPPNIKFFNGNDCVRLGSKGLMKLTGLRNLQVLSMRNCNLSQVSREIGNLVSLESLDLSENTFSTLPDGFSNLSRLVDLQIDGCSELQYLPLLPSNLETIHAVECSSLDVMPFDSVRTANIFRSKMFKESLFTRTLCIGLSGMETPDWCSTTYEDRRNVFSCVVPMHIDKKIGVAILLLGVTSDIHHVLLHSRMLNKTKETSASLDDTIGHHFGTSRRLYPSRFFIFYPLDDTTLMVEAGDTVALQFDEGHFWSCGLTWIYEGDVIDSAIVIQNRNLTQEHTFRVPSEMNAAASVT